MTALETCKPRRDLALLIELQGNRCAFCGGRMVPAGDCGLFQDLPTEDHVEPRSQGGSDSLLNKVAMHRRCNEQKSDARANGCVLIWHQIVLAKIGVGAVNEKSGAKLFDIWPTA